MNGPPAKCANGLKNSKGCLALLIETPCMKMKTKFLFAPLVAALFILLTAFDFPSDWIIGGSKYKCYYMGTEKGAGRDGKNAATLLSVNKKINGFGTLMQNSLPDKFLGKRVRMTGYMKTADVKEWAGLWFRVDQQFTGQALGFDNMHDGSSDRSLGGTKDWTRCELVLDVPLSASNLAYGALLQGTGQIWLDDINFEIVDKSIPVTCIQDGFMPLLEPTNLDFEK